MKNNKQSKELNDKIKIIERYYNNLINYFKHFDTELLDSDLLSMLERAIEKAKAWDIFKAKCSKGAKVACSNLSKKERIERARQAGYANAKRIEKEKQRKRQNQINKHRI